MRLLPARQMSVFLASFICLHFVSMSIFFEGLAAVTHWFPVLIQHHILHLLPSLSVRKEYWEIAYRWEVKFPLKF